MDAKAAFMLNLPVRAKCPGWRFYRIENSSDKTLCEDAHANADAVCRPGGAFAAQSFAKVKTLAVKK